MNTNWHSTGPTHSRQGTVSGGTGTRTSAGTVAGTSAGTVTPPPAGTSAGKGATAGVSATLEKAPAKFLGGISSPPFLDRFNAGLLMGVDLGVTKPRLGDFEATTRGGSCTISLLAFGAGVVSPTTIFFFGEAFAVGIGTVDLTGVAIGFGTTAP